MTMKISKPTRQFVDQNLVVDSWESIEKYYTDLIDREISTKEDFLTWLKDQSELEGEKPGFLHGPRTEK